MTTRQFEKQIRHLDQIQILSGAISSLNKLLVDKNIVAPAELQNYFSAWMMETGLRQKKAKKGDRNNHKSPRRQPHSS